MRLRVVAAAFAAALSLLPRAHAGVQKSAHIISGIEGAEFRGNRLLSWKPAPSNGKIPPGAELRCARPCIVQVDSDNMLELAPGAIIAVGDFFFVPLVAGAASLTPAHQIELREGAVQAISPSDKSLPLVITVGGSEHAALRGARVQVVARADKTAVGVLSGQARVGGNRSWVTVETGFGSAVNLHGRPSAPRALVATPQWAVATGACPAGISVTEPDGRVVVGGCWEKIPEARSYEVEVARDPGFHDRVLLPESTATTSWSTIVGVGRYYARVRGVDADGLMGKPSSPRQLAVVPCLLPPGSSANMETRTLVVPEGREIAFGDPKGVELAIDKGGFMLAPKSIIMDSEPSHELRFRLHDDPSSVSTVYIARRRALRANVQLSPRRAEWPADPIEISVKLEDPSGQLDPSHVGAELKVLVGVREVPVKWTRNGAVFTAHLAPQPTAGPTVVRVIASDEHGTQIGRSFLEVDRKTLHAGSEALDGRQVAHNGGE